MSDKNPDDESNPTENPEPPLKEGEDYYVENGFFVFTAMYLLRRGYCCNNGCRHCPYKNK